MKILNISETRLADEHLHHLEAFSGLGMLDVNRTAITDQGLASLGFLQGIESINLEGTQVTAQGVASLRGLLPNTTIHWTPPSSEQP